MRNILLLCLFLAQFIHLSASTFTPGNIVIVRVGDGTVTPSNASTLVFLDEYSPTGALVQTIALPAARTSGNHALTLSGVATSEGALSLSANGQYLSLAGYDTTVGYAGVASGIANRTVGRIGVNGTINTTTGFNTGSAYVSGNFRSAISNDGNEFWTTGSGSAGGGLWYIPFGSFTSAAVQMNATYTNVRVANIYNGQLYFSITTGGTPGIYSEGTGLPTSAGQTSTLLPGLPSIDSLTSPFEFVFLDENPAVAGPDVLYVADDNVIAPKGGIYKYSLVNGIWVSNGNIPNADGIRGITGYHICSGSKLFLTSTVGLYSFFDSTGYNQTISGSYTQILTAANNTAIRGVAFTPGTVLPGSPQVAVASLSNISCYGANNGSINITTSGGSAPFHYFWSGGSIAQNRTNLIPGTYTVTATDANGCTASVSATISQPAALQIHIDSITNLPCTGGSTGAITISVTGGTGIHTYHWSNNSTTQNLTAISAGTYYVTVTDSASCVKIDTAIVSQSGNLVVNDSLHSPACFGGNDGAIVLHVSGGTPSYTYHWTNADTTASITGLVAGTYTVTIADHAGCVLTRPISLSQPAKLLANLIDTSVSCFGRADGSISSLPSGGTAPYSYAWSPVGNPIPALVNLGPGIYSLTVTDSHGCTVSAQATINQPAVITVVSASTHVSTFGGSDGSVSLTVSGGTGGSYQYTWTNGATTQNLANITAGTYCVTVTDLHGCSATVCSTVTQPSGINDVDWLTTFKAYTTDHTIYVDLLTTGDMSIRASLCGLSGDVIYQTPTTFSSSLSLHIPTAGIAAGIYLLNITTDHGISSKKIVLVK